MLFIVNDYIFLLRSTIVSPFSTYKYNLGVWGKTKQKQPQTQEFTQKCYSFLLDIILRHWCS